MREWGRFGLAKNAADTMASSWELDHQQEAHDLDQMMRRLKDLSANSLTHAGVRDHREVVELLVLGMFFGASSDPRYRKNQACLLERLCLRDPSGKVI